MKSKLLKTSLCAMALAAVMFSGGLLQGCKNGAEMSAKELADVKKGPPKEMPAEARQIMERAGRQAPPTAGKTGN